MHDASFQPFLLLHLVLLFLLQHFLLMNSLQRQHFWNQVIYCWLVARDWKLVRFIGFCPWVFLNLFGQCEYNYRVLVLLLLDVKSNIKRVTSANVNITQENAKHFNSCRGWKDWDAVQGKKEYSFFRKLESSLQMSHKKFQYKQGTRSVKINTMSWQS